MCNGQVVICDEGPADEGQADEGQGDGGQADEVRPVGQGQGERADWEVRPVGQGHGQGEEGRCIDILSLMMFL